MLLQIVFDIFVVVAISLYFIRKNRPQKDDPRLSRGLQLLQSKIAVLEDLSDRVETQVKQLTTILDEKTKEIHHTINDAEEKIRDIEKSMHKSMEVAKIFQDRIPHEEIIERQNTAKYLEAAKLAHAGASAEEIAEKLKIPRSEADMISRLNRDELSIRDEDIPAWLEPDFQRANLTDDVQS